MPQKSTKKPTQTTKVIAKTPVKVVIKPNTVVKVPLKKVATKVTAAPKLTPKTVSTVESKKNNWWNAGKIFGMVVSLLVLFWIVVSLTVYVGDYKKVTETRQMDRFSRVEFNGAGDLTIKQGNSFNIEIKGEEGKLDNVITEVFGSTLRIYEDYHWYSFLTLMRKKEFVVTVPFLEKLEMNGAGIMTLTDYKSAGNMEIVLNGAGDIKLVNVDIYNLKVALNGAGDINGNGRAVRQDIAISGAGDYDGENLYGEKGEALVVGAGTITINVSTTLDAKVNGIGSVLYLGSPELTKEVDGLGNIKNK